LKEREHGCKISRLLLIKKGPLLHFGRLIKTLNTAIERDINRQLAKFDLTGTQGTIIGFLRHNQDREICQKNLEQEFALSHPTMSSILTRMESKGLIGTAPLPKDKRYKKVFLTEKGLALDKEIAASIDKYEAKMCTGLSEEQQIEIKAYLNVLIKNLMD
jgi:DNA-binding MarR family transcriptional regulator